MASTEPRRRWGGGCAPVRGRAAPPRRAPCAMPAAGSRRTRHGRCPGRRGRTRRRHGRGIRPAARARAAAAAPPRTPRHAGPTASGGRRARRQQTAGSRGGAGVAVRPAAAAALVCAARPDAGGACGSGRRRAGESWAGEQGRARPCCRVARGSPCRMPAGEGGGGREVLPGWDGGAAGREVEVPPQRRRGPVELERGLRLAGLERGGPDEVPPGGGRA